MLYNYEKKTEEQEKKIGSIFTSLLSMIIRTGLTHNRTKDNKRKVERVLHWEKNGDKDLEGLIIGFIILSSAFSNISFQHSAQAPAV